jgi:tetratricopeptide (TPR) repeat protein
MGNLALRLKERGQRSEALEWLRKAADRAISLINETPWICDPWPGEGGDEGISNSILNLAELLSELGEDSEAEQWFQKGTAIGDGRAASALADLCLERGQPSPAARWRKKAAELSYANLSRNKRELLQAYGNPGVQRHIRIIQKYIAYLDDQGNTQAARIWQQRAADHLPPSTF